jgi:hypothetical protein
MIKFTHLEAPRKLSSESLELEEEVEEVEPESE